MTPVWGFGGERLVSSGVLRGLLLFWWGGNEKRGTEWKGCIDFCDDFGSFSFFLFLFLFLSFPFLSIFFLFLFLFFLEGRLSLRPRLPRKDNQLLTIKFLEDTLHGAGAAATAHGDIEFVFMLCVGHGYFRCRLVFLDSWA